MIQTIQILFSCINKFGICPSNNPYETNKQELSEPFVQVLE